MGFAFSFLFEIDSAVKKISITVALNLKFVAQQPKVSMAADHYGQWAGIHPIQAVTRLHDRLDAGIVRFLCSVRRLGHDTYT
jgi:hypothetical protein